MRPGPLPRLPRLPRCCAERRVHARAAVQGIKHTRRQLRAQGLDPGSASQPGTPASCGSPLGGSRSTSPARAARGRHSRHSSADWGPGGVGIAAAAMAAAAAEPPPESLICSVCGIMATSAVNLEVRGLAWGVAGQGLVRRTAGRLAAGGLLRGLLAARVTLDAWRRQPSQP